MERIERKCLATPAVLSSTEVIYKTVGAVSIKALINVCVPFEATSCFYCHHRPSHFTNR